MLSINVSIYLEILCFMADFLLHFNIKQGIKEDQEKLYDDITANPISMSACFYTSYQYLLVSLAIV